MNIKEFSKKMRLRAKLGEDGEVIVAGRRGEIYHYDNSLLALLLMPPKKFVWAHARRKLEAVGCTILQDGDQEGAASFNPENPTQTRLVLRLVGVKPKRRARLSPAFIAARERFKFRRATVQEGHGTAQKPVIEPGAAGEKGQEETTLVYAGGGHEGTTGSGS